MYNFYRQLKVYLKGRKSSRIIFLVAFVMIMLYYVIIILRNRFLLILQRELFTGEIIDQSCKIPDLPVDSPEIVKHISHVEKITCDTVEDWVIVNATHAFVTDQAKAKLGGSIDCKFYEITRVNEDSINARVKFKQGQMYKFESVDFIEVLCTANAENWSSFFAAPRSSVTLPDKTTIRRPAEHPPLNVLMLGHDSLSRNMFIRKLPSTYEYLTKQLGGQTLEGYNIVGDGTPQALIPILTGKEESELPETRKRKGAEATYVNIYPFVWKEFSSKGYLTGFIEDCSGIGTFTYRLKGFKDQPTDFYMRPFFVAAEPYFNKESQQGKQEERKPFFMFVFPKWFHKIYPLAYKNFVTNTKRLSTPFDIHPTLQDILNLETLSAHKLSTPNSILFREMSLFREIPANRTCANAHIEPHWCACLEWRSMDPNSAISHRAAQLTDSNRKMCAELEISKILWAASFHPKKELLKFKKSADMDGREADLSDNTIVNIANLQLKLETAPGNGHYEVTLAYNIADQEFIIRESDISRINKYASQATCVETDDRRLEHLRKYCYCKNK